MGEPLDQLLGSIPLTDDIRAALLTRKGQARVLPRVL